MGKNHHRQLSKQVKREMKQTHTGDAINLTRGSGGARGEWWKTKALRDILPARSTSVAQGEVMDSLKLQIERQNDYVETWGEAEAHIQQINGQ